MAHYRPLFTLICQIIGKSMPDGYTITVPKCAFSGREKNQVGHIQNGRLSAIIVVNMHNIWKNVPDSYTIKQNFRLHKGMHPEKFIMADFRQSLTETPRN